MDYYAIYSDLAKKATFGQVEQASKWYVDAEKVAHEVARNLDTYLEVGASVVSAFSPRERWTTNVAKAISFSLGNGIEKKTPNQSQYNELASAVKKVAFDFGMTPRAMQALIWIMIRGSGE